MRSSGCMRCGSDRPVIAHGLCRPCYMHDYNRRPDVRVKIADRDAARAADPAYTAVRREYEAASRARNAEGRSVANREAARRRRLDPEYRAAQSRAARDRRATDPVLRESAHRMERVRQDETRTRAANHGAAWTPGDDVVLLLAATHTEAAILLGRTYWSVRARLRAITAWAAR